MSTCKLSCRADVEAIIKECVVGIAKAVLTGDTGEMEFPGGFDVDISVKDNASATSFDMYGDITLRFLDKGKEVDVTITRKEESK
jgi:hypothetical protein